MTGLGIFLALPPVGGARARDRTAAILTDTHDYPRVASTRTVECRLGADPASTAFEPRFRFHDARAATPWLRLTHTQG